MAAEKLTSLPAVTTVTAADLLYVVDSPATSKKVTFANFQASLVIPLDAAQTSGLLPVTAGGMGVSTLGAYRLIAGGTSNTGPVQSLDAGTSGQLLVSQGPSAIPAWHPTTGRITLPLDVFDSFTTARKYSSALSGTGAVAVGTGSYEEGSYKLTTGATAASSANVFVIQGVGDPGAVQNPYNFSPEMAAVAKLTTDTSTNFVSWLLFGGNTTIPASGTGVLTQKHMGFILDTTTLYASSANGTTQVMTDITGSLSMTRGHVFRVVQTGSTDIKFYVDGVLVATHTTSLPTGSLSSNSYCEFGLRNDAGVTTNRAFHFGGGHVSWAC